MRPQPKDQSSASIYADLTRQETITFWIEGRLDSKTTGQVWREATEILKCDPEKHIVVDASKIKYCDGLGIGLLLELLRRQQRAGAN